MRLTRIYYDGLLAVDQSIVLSQLASHHLVNVLRLSLNSPFVVFNGKGGEYSAHITDINSSGVVAAVDQYIALERESILNIHLGQSVCRPDKMDWIIQKSVELGVSTISPLLTERSLVQFKAERGEKKYEHWHKVMIHACEQSGRTRLPILSSVIDLSIWLSRVKSENKFILHTQKEERTISSYPKANDAILLIGPEGGWGKNEIQLALQQGFQLLNLGPRILRVETAALAALTAFQSHWGDLG